MVRPTSISPRLALGLLVLLAAALRFPTLGSQSLWFDEAATWELTQLPFGEMLSALPDRESNPPLFYVLEWLLVRVFGDGEAALRLLSALAGTALVPVAYGIGSRVGGARVGLATAALVAVNPLLIWFSQEARSYELVALLSAAGLLAFLRALDDDRPRALAWWALLSALALCTHYFACFVLVPQIVWLLWRDPRRRALPAALLALALVALALLPMLLEQRDNPYDIAGASVGTRLLQIPKQFLLGYRGPLALLFGLLGGALALGALWLLRDAAARVRERALLVAAIGLAGLLLPLAGAVVGFDYVNARNLIPALVPLAVVLAAGFAAPAAAATGRRAAAGPLLLGVLCLVSVATVIVVAADQQYRRPDWKGLAKALGTTAGPRAIVVAPANGETALRYYRPGLGTMGRDGELVREVDVVSVAGSRGPGERPELPRLFLDNTVLAVPGFGEPERIETPSWVMLRYRVPRALPVFPDPLGAVRFSQLPPAVDVLPGGR